MANALYDAAQGGGRRYEYVPPKRRPKPQKIQAYGIASAEAFGNVKLNQNIQAAGIASKEIFGKPTIEYRISEDEEMLILFSLAA